MRRVSYAPYASDGAEAQSIQGEFEAAYPDSNPTIFVNYGYAVASILGQALDAACASATSSYETYVLRADADTPGGLVIEQELFESPYAESFTG